MSRRDTALKYITEQETYLHERAEKDIERYRKGNCVLKFIEQDGLPVQNVKCRVTLKKHEFQHGCGMLLLDELQSEEKNEIFRLRFAELFNLGTIPFYWKDLEPIQGKPRFVKNSPRVYRRPAPDLCLEYCQQNHIEPKLHCLNYMQFTPDWVPDDIRQTKILLEKRFYEIAERYADKIPGIEVINETLLNCTRAFFRAPDLIEWSFQAAEKYFPNNELIINEAGGIYDNWNRGNRMPYFMLVERALQNGARIDTVGIQSHLFFKAEDEADKVNSLANPEHIYQLLDQLAQLGKPLQITEITIPAYTDCPEDEEIQAELLKTLYTIWFSHPAVKGAIYWNLVDGYAYRAEPGDMTSGENYYRGTLLRFDMSKKPAYDTLWELFHKTWHTDVLLVGGQDGMATFRGFYGTYDLEITCNGKTVRKEIQLLKNASSQFQIVI